MEIMKDPSSFGERWRRSSTTHGCVWFFCLIGRPSGPGWVEGSIFRTEPGSLPGRFPYWSLHHLTAALPRVPRGGLALTDAAHERSAPRALRERPRAVGVIWKRSLTSRPPLRLVRNSDPVYPRVRISGVFAFSKEYDTQLPMPMPSLHGTRTGPIADSWPGRHITSPTLQTFRYRERLALPRAVFVTSRCASTATSRYV